MERKLNHRQRMQIRIRRLQLKKPSAVLLLCAAAVLLAGGILLPRLLRKPAAAATVLPDEGAPLVMDFVGDVMLDRNIRTLGERNGYDALFDGVRDSFGKADLVFANLENSVINNTRRNSYTFPDAKIRLACSRTALNSAKRAGINMFSCANNHAMDYGRNALNSMLSYFERTDTVYTGITVADTTFTNIGNDSIDPSVCQLRQINGYTVAFLSVTDVFEPGTSAGTTRSGVLTTNSTGFFETVYTASRSADLTVVYVHWGEENITKVTEAQEQIGHRLIDAGADIVIGSHPHVLQKTELYRNGIIFYSLGNFIFDQGNTLSKDTVLVQFTLDEDGNGLFELVPMRAVDGVPYETDSHFYRARITHTLTQALTTADYYTNELGHIVIPAVTVHEDSPFTS